jgi:hypothetical protein
LVGRMATVSGQTGRARTLAGRVEFNFAFALAVREMFR